MAAESTLFRARSAAAIARTTFAVGRHEVVALNDGEFTMAPDFLTDPTPHAALRGEDGAVRLPLGCFFLPGDAPLLVDTGFGPRTADILRGGLLLDELAAIGVHPAQIETVAISHLHRDHRGWLADATGEAVFPNATILVGEADWSYFYERTDQPRPLEASERAYLAEAFDRGRVVLMDGEHEIAPGVVAIPAPGHTPGHTVFAIVDHDERALLLGDSMYCPQQLDVLEWGAIVDVDAELARATREALWRDLEAHDGLGVGCHFPGLAAARLLRSS